MRFQQRIVDAENLEELKALCELSDYRLYFTRTKWTQIMECVALVLFSKKSTNKIEENVKSNLKNKPPKYMESQLIKTNNESASNALNATPSQNSSLNLKFNLFKNIGSLSQTSEHNHTAKSRVTPINTDKSTKKLNKVFFTFF